MSRCLGKQFSLAFDLVSIKWFQLSVSFLEVFQNGSSRRMTAVQRVVSNESNNNKETRSLV